MTQRLHSPRIVLPLFFLAIVPFAASGSGCANQAKSHLRLHSIENGQFFAQQFRQAYFARTVNGEYEVVLIDDGNPQPSKGKRGEPLQASNTAPLRQVVHIRIHWRPPHGTRPDHPSATNAVVDWYVNGAGPASQDRLHYQGVAFVQINPSGDMAKVQLRNGQLSLEDSGGSMQDPLGRSGFAGSVVATRNESMVAAATEPFRLDALLRVRPAAAGGR